MQGFADRAERDAAFRIEQWETGLRVARYRRGDRVRIMGDILFGELANLMGEFVRIDRKGRIIVRAEGKTMLGRPIEVTLDPSQVRLAAE